MSCWYCSRVKNVSLLVSHTPATTWSWIKPRSGLPDVGTRYWLSVLASMRASAWAVSDCGKCMFISSPSKSALYELQLA